MEFVKTNKGRFLLVLGACMLFSSTISAQELGLQDAADNLWSEIKGAAPVIFAIIFLVSVMMNIGKVTGGDRDYKGFLVGMGLWLGGMVIVGGILGYILSIQF